MIAYKLTDQNMQTYNGFQWSLNKEATSSGEGKLCSNGWLHFYSDPLLAIFLNPIHANIKIPRLFEGIAGNTLLHDGELKSGTTSLILTKELDVPFVSITNRIAFGILCAKKVYFNVEWNKWADDWLNNVDRTEKSAVNACDCARDNTAAACASADVMYPTAKAGAIVPSIDKSITRLTQMAKDSLLIK